jgi:hypothetical protein
MRLPDLEDLLFFGGLAVLTYGLYQVHPATAFIVLGVCCVACGLRTGRDEEKPR